MAKKYSTFTDTPFIAKANFADGDVFGNLHRLDLPVRGGESVMLKTFLLST